MIRCASGSIQVVTKVARLRCGIAVEDQLLADQPHRVDRRHPVVGDLVVGCSLDQPAAAEALGKVIDVLLDVH